MASNVLSRIAVVITANTAQMIGQLGQANKKLSVVSSSLNTLKNTMLGTFGAYAVINSIKNAVGTIAGFDKQITAVKAITGATGEEFDRLRSSALTLGQTTQYTAEQVAGLQLEFGRLGFSTEEILESTKATIDLATATGEDLVRSAEIAGSTLRAFQLDASDMGRVTDIMASALNESALTLESFAESVKYVAPVAKASNVSLSETAAILSVLSDAGLKGSIAGTGLRRILSLLAKDGKTLKERFEELSKAGITLAQANDEVGLLAQTQLLVIANHIDEIQKLTSTYNDNAGSTERLAEIMEDNLATSMTKVGTAWDALILSFNTSDKIQSFMDGIAIGIRKMAGGTGALKDEFNKLLKVIEKEAGYQKGEEALKRLKVVSSELGRELRVTRDEFGKIKGVYEKFNEGFSGPDVFDPKTLLKGGEQALIEHGQKIAEERQKELDRIKASREEREKQFKIERDIYNLALAANAQDDKSPYGIGEDVAPLDFGNTFSGNKTNFADTIRGMLLEQEKEMVEDLGNKYETFFNKIVAGTEKETEANEKAAESWLRKGEMIAGIIDSVIAKDATLLQSLARTAAQTIAMNSKEIISWISLGLAKTFGKTGSVIAAGLALGVITGLLNKVARGKNYGGADVARKPSARYADSGVYVSGEFRMQGSTAVALVNKGEYQKSRLG